MLKASQMLVLSHHTIYCLVVVQFAAILRHEQDSEASGPVCVKMDMTAGHFSASDRYKYLKELSFDYAFLLDQLGISNADS